MARRAELSGIALGTEDGQEILKGVAEALGMVIDELINDLEEGAQRFRVAVGQVGVFENVTEERRDAVMASLYRSRVS